VIKVGGSDTMVNLAQAWAEEYGKKYPNVQIQVSGGGSGVGIAKLTEGTIDLANSSREVKPDEITKLEAARFRDSLSPWMRWRSMSTRTTR